MADETRAILKAFFETGDVPTEAEYIKLIDSIPNKKDDKIRLKPVHTLTDGAAIGFNVELGKNAKLTIGGNRTLNLTNLADGDEGVIVVTQDGTGGRTIALGTVNGGGGTHKISDSQASPLLLSIGAGSIGILKFYYDGVTVYWSTFNNFA